MRGTRFLLALVVLVVAHSLLATNSAEALTVLTSPFGSAPVTGSDGRKDATNGFAGIGGTSDAWWDLAIVPQTDFSIRREENSEVLSWGS